MEQTETSPNPAFHDVGYTVIRSFVDKSRCAFLYHHALAVARQGVVQLADPQAPNTPSKHGDPMMDALLATMLPRVEQETGFRLYPTYSYFRVYKTGDVLKKHTDRAACEISVTVNLGFKGAEPWPIWLERDGVARAAALEPGDAAVYRGIEIPHWREAFTGEQSVQVFLHYVNQDGPHAEWKFDRRPALTTLRKG